MVKLLRDLPYPVVSLTLHVNDCRLYSSNTFNTYEVIQLVQSVVLIGGILTVAMILIGFLLLKASAKSKYLPYYPGIVLFLSGIVFIVVATIVDKIVIAGAGLGGWGIACLFASAISFIITSMFDVYVRA